MRGVIRNDECIRQSSVVNFWKATGSSVSTRAPLIEARSGCEFCMFSRLFGFECQARPEVSYPMGKGQSAGIGGNWHLSAQHVLTSQVTLAFMTLPAEGLAFQWASPDALCYFIACWGRLPSGLQSASHHDAPSALRSDVKSCCKSEI